MKTLSDLLHRISNNVLQGSTSFAVQGLAFDSRKVTTGFVFVAVKGTQTDGHSFIDAVVAQGASAIVCEDAPDNMHQGVTYIQVPNSAYALGVMASNFYNNPSSKLKIVAVTGTNGKTTNVTLLYQLFTALGYKVGMLSTVQNYIDTEIVPATHTTPDSLQMQMLMSKMVDKGCTHCFMEASSHAIHQHRMSGILLSGAVFTNITHDHLDYHITFDNYIKAKKKLFDDLPESAFALSNRDDKRGEVMLQNTRASKHYFSLKGTAEFRGKVLANALTGLEIDIEQQHIWFRLIGEFNAYNLMGVYATAVLLGEPKQKVLTLLSAATGAKGRFEQVLSATGIIGIVDYAHTPDAVENVLQTISELRSRNEKVITVIGCGGNRDAAKRPVMAQIASKLSDVVVLTSDNPRNEDPEAILNEMEAGIKPSHFKKYKRITDRTEAIAYAVQLAKPKDIILLAGKGHEDYQEIKGVKHPFDDCQTLRNAYKTLNK